MLWKNRRASGNVLDQRHLGAKALGGGGLLIGAIVVALMGGNPLQFIMANLNQGSSSSSSTGSDDNGAGSELKGFAAVVLADTEDVWNEIFQSSNQHYQEPKLVLFSRSVQSACGQASSAIGPFYCPGDQRIYLDLQFFDQLSSSLGAQGDFAAAYVIAHEVGHHVQNLLGIEKSLRQRQSAAGGDRSRNQLSVQMELQADCLAGVWAKRTEQSKQVIEAGDIDEAMNAAAAVGDDRLQQSAGGEVMPDSFTHGSSAQRGQAFHEGFNAGNPQTCLSNYL